MEKKKRRLPSAAMIVAVVALVAAITGTAIAGPDAFTSISKTKTKKIANQQAKKQINKRTPWTGNDIADGAVSSSKLSDESVKSDELGEISTRTSNTTIAANATGTASVSCESGEKVVSGGWEGPPTNVNTGPVLISSSDKKNNEGWTTSATNFGDAPGQLTVYAYCLEESG